MIFDSFLGILLALVAALVTAITSLLIRIGTRKGRANDAVIVVLLCNILLIIPLAAVVYYPNYALTRVSIAAFVSAGILGTMFGRLCYYTGIEKIGSSRTEPIKASQPLHATVIAVIVLGETVGALHFVGILLVMLGVGVISWETAHDNPGKLPKKQLWFGLAFGLGAALFYGVEPMFAKLGFGQGTPGLVGLAVKTFAATLGFFGYLWWRNALPSLSKLRTNDTKWYVAAGIANSAFLMSYYAALEISPVAVVVPIVQTSPLMVVLLSFAFLPRRLEQVTWKLTAAAAVVVAGAVMVTFFSS